MPRRPLPAALTAAALAACCAFQVGCGDDDTEGVVDPAPVAPVDGDADMGMDADGGMDMDAGTPEAMDNDGVGDGMATDDPDVARPSEEMDGE